MGMLTRGTTAVPVPAPAGRPSSAVACPAAGAAIILLLAGCTGDREREMRSARESFASCGDVRAGGGVDVERATREGARCLQGALDSGKAAELRVALTIEGDPITRYFRVTSAGRFEIYTDATHDTYGSGRWEYQDCGQRESLARLSC